MILEMFLKCRRNSSCNKNDYRTLWIMTVLLLLLWTKRLNQSSNRVVVILLTVTGPDTTNTLITEDALSQLQEKQR